MTAVFAAHERDLGGCFAVTLGDMIRTTGANGVVRVQILPTGAVAGARDSVSFVWRQRPMSGINMELDTGRYERCIEPLVRTWLFPPSQRQTLGEYSFYFPPSS